MRGLTLVRHHLPVPVSAPNEIAHYTRISNLTRFIKQPTPGWSSAWATPVQFLNDRAELTLGLDVLLSVANQPPHTSRRVVDEIIYLQDTLGSQDTDAFQMSFSGNPDELGQWRGYAANGLGCSVTIDPVSLIDLKVRPKSALKHVAG